MGVTVGPCDRIERAENGLRCTETINLLCELK